jgi:hypothetical protein
MIRVDRRLIKARANELRAGFFVFAAGGVAHFESNRATPPREKSALFKNEIEAGQ